MPTGTRIKLWLLVALFAPPNTVLGDRYPAAPPLSPPRFVTSMAPLCPLTLSPFCGFVFCSSSSDSWGQIDEGGIRSKLVIAEEADDAPCVGNAAFGSENFKSALGLDRSQFCEEYVVPRNAHLKSTPGHAYIGSYTQGSLSRAGLTASIEQHTRQTLRNAGLLLEESASSQAQHSFHLSQAHRVNHVAGMTLQLF
jgi:hypothetical protein